MVRFCSACMKDRRFHWRKKQSFWHMSVRDSLRMISCNRLFWQSIRKSWVAGKRMSTRRLRWRYLSISWEKPVCVGIVYRWITGRQTPCWQFAKDISAVRNNWAIIGWQSWDWPWKQRSHYWRRFSMFWWMRVRRRRIRRLQTACQMLS